MSAQTEPGQEPGPGTRLDEQGRACDMALVESRVAASAQYLMRIIVSEMLKHFPFFVCFICIGRNECDPDGMCSLDRDAFARGMGQIDEELSKAGPTVVATPVEPKRMEKGGLCVARCGGQNL